MDDWLDELFAVAMEDDIPERENRGMSRNACFDSLACPNVRYDNIMDSIEEYKQSNVWN